MKSYEVGVTGSITKWITVEADSENQASELANEVFTLDVEADEKYYQETISVREIKLEGENDNKIEG